MENNNINRQEEQSIDIMAILKRLWSKRKFILIITGGFTALGLLCAICMKPKYESSCTFVPQFSSPMQALSLYSFGGMIPDATSLEQVLSGETLSPLVYPQLLKDVEFNKELMNTPVHFRKYQEPISLYEWKTNPKYKKFDLIANLKKYTIDLPKTIFNKLKPEEPTIVLSDDSKGVSFYTKSEYNVAKKIEEMLDFKVDKKEFFFSLTTTAEDPIEAAEFCKATIELMQKYIVDFKINKAKQNYEFLQGIYDEAKEEYQQKQLVLARYNDANRGSLTATTQTRKEQLKADYDIAYTAFSEASKQLLLAEVKLKEDTPAFSMVENVSVPLKKSNSRIKLFFIWVFAGLFVGCGLVIGLDYLQTLGLKWPKKWS